MTTGPSGRGVGLAVAVVSIAGLTVLARLVGFARIVVFAGVVGSTDLGDIYQTANTVPNIIFEIVAGGALAVLVVPLLAGPIAEGDTDRVSRIASALLGWTLLLLVPLAVVLALAADPAMTLLAGPTAGPAAIDTGADMLRVFAIQLPLYGVGVVLTGVLFAHHRFTWPALAPLLSSVTVIGVYLLFAAVAGPDTSISSVSPTGVFVLAAGTTLGVAVLTLCLLIPIRSLRLGIRPSLHLDRPARSRAGGLAGAAVVIVAAQQVATAVVIALANRGADGTVVLFSLAQTVFLLPWAVLAVPLSTPTFPVLARLWASGDEAGYDATLAGTTRAVLLAAGLGTAALIAVAVPGGALLSAITKSHPSAALLAAAIVAIAPGLFGYSLFALLNRAWSAIGRSREVALAAAVGWGTTVVVAMAVVGSVPATARVSALAGANSVGMSVLGMLLVWVVWRRRGVAALVGVGRTLLVSLVAAGVAGGLGWCVGWLLDAHTPGVGGSVVTGMLAGTGAAAAFLAVVVALDRTYSRPVVGAAIRRLTRRAASGATGGTAKEGGGDRPG